MRNILLIVGVLVTSFLFAGLAFGQAGVISIFSDQAGTDPYYWDSGPGEVNFYVVHINAPYATACQFSAPKPDCFNATYIGDTYVFPVTLGNSQESVAIGYGACLSSPIHVLTITYFTNGNSTYCCEYPVTDYLVGDFTYGLHTVAKIEVVDCDENLLDGVGGTLVINPQGCDCAQPSLVLDGYQTVAWEDPYWTVQVQMRNTGPAAALDVSATMHEDIPWLVTPDANCFYGDVASGAASWGGEDTYVFDLTDHPGGPFNAWFDVTYVDTCGYEHTIRLDPEFSLEEVTASVPDAMTAAPCLGVNYPNPFNPTTTIPLNIAEAGNVHLSIFDSQGKLVRVLVDEHVPVGSRQVIWNGRDANGSAVSSGVYFARLTTGTAMETRKLVLLK